MQIKVVGHHGCTQDSQRDQHCILSWDRGQEGSARIDGGDGGRGERLGEREREVAVGVGGGLFAGLLHGDAKGGAAQRGAAAVVADVPDRAQVARDRGAGGRRGVEGTPVGDRGGVGDLARELGKQRVAAAEGEDDQRDERDSHEATLARAAAVIAGGVRENPIGGSAAS